MNPQNPTFEPLHPDPHSPNLSPPKNGDQADSNSIFDLKADIQNDKESDTLNEDPVSQERIKKLLKMENLADITLAGFVLKLIRAKGPMSFQAISDEVVKCFDALRRPDGSKYHGDHVKALMGCLSLSGVFVEKEKNSGVWKVDEKKAKPYEERTTEKIKLALKRQLLPEKESPSMKRPFEALENTLEVLNVTCKVFKTEKKAEFFVHNPLRDVKRSDGLKELSQKFGKERFDGVMQCFDYFLPILEDYMKLKSGSFDSEEV